MRKKEHSSVTMPRRDFLKLAAATSAVAVLPTTGARAETASSTAEKPLRVIHMTDHHLMDFQNQRGSEKGIEVAFAHAMTFEPDVIANGGDMLTHGMIRPLEDMKKDAQTFLNYVPRAGVRVINACGNHDIWGWDKEKAKATGNEPLFGKNFFREYFGEGELYKESDLGAWRMMVIDSTQPLGSGYQGGLDDEQFEWLEGALMGGDRSSPVIILGHIPILNAGIVLQDAVIGSRTDSRRGVTIPKSSCQQDLWRMVDLFHRHGNVKIALSGHVHVDECTDMLGTSHISGGAVCGSWWKPREVVAAGATARAKSDGLDIIRPPRADPGFMVLDLYPDGRFTQRYELLPWEFILG